MSPWAIHGPAHWTTHGPIYWPAHVVSHEAYHSSVTLSSIQFSALTRIPEPVPVQDEGVDFRPILDKVELIIHAPLQSRPPRDLPRDMGFLDRWRLLTAVIMLVRFEGRPGGAKYHSVVCAPAEYSLMFNGLVHFSIHFLGQANLMCWSLLRCRWCAARRSLCWVSTRTSLAVCLFHQHQQILHRTPRTREVRSTSVASQATIC